MEDSPSGSADQAEDPFRSASSAFVPPATKHDLPGDRGGSHTNNLATPTSTLTTGLIRRIFSHQGGGRPTTTLRESSLNLRNDDKGVPRELGSNTPSAWSPCPRPGPVNKLTAAAAAAAAIQHNQRQQYELRIRPVHVCMYVYIYIYIHRHCIYSTLVKHPITAYTIPSRVKTRILPRRS